MKGLKGMFQKQKKKEIERCVWKYWKIYSVGTEFKDKLMIQRKLSNFGGGEPKAIIISKENRKLYKKYITWLFFAYKCWFNQNLWHIYSIKNSGVGKRNVGEKKQLKSNKFSSSKQESH